MIYTLNGKRYLAENDRLFELVAVEREREREEPAPVERGGRRRKVKKELLRTGSELSKDRFKEKLLARKKKGKGGKNACGKCGQVGHNRKTCPNPEREEDENEDDT